MKVFAWLNSDLDGVASAVLLGQMFKDFEFRSVFFGDFERQFSEWFEENSDSYDYIFVVGMVYDQGMINRLDDHKIIFVSDGPDKPNVYDSTFVQEETTSCCRLLYKRFKEVKFPANVVKFIAYVDDYNSYTLKTVEAKYINALYRKSTVSKKFASFVQRFKDGYDGLTTSEQKAAEQFFHDIEEEASTLDIYEGDFKGSRVLAFFTKKSANEMAAAVLDNYQADAVIVVNLDTQFVSFRTKKDSKADAKLMAENLCKGGGNKESAGGKITEKFLEFTQTLTVI